MHGDTCNSSGKGTDLETCHQRHLEWLHTLIPLPLLLIFEHCTVKVSYAYCYLLNLDTGQISSVSAAKTEILHKLHVQHPLVYESTQFNLFIYILI